MSHTPGPWKGDCFDGTVKYAITGPNGELVLAVNHKGSDYGFKGPNAEDDERLALAAPDLLEVARIEQELHMSGFTKATAKRLGPEAEEAFMAGGVPGLNDWRRRKRESAIAKAEGQ